MKLKRFEPKSEPDFPGVLEFVESVVLLDAWLDKEFVSKLLLNLCVSILLQHQ